MVLVATGGDAVVVSNKQDLALLDAAFNASRRESLVCRTSTLQTTIGRLCRNLLTSLRQIPCYCLCITIKYKNDKRLALTARSPSDAVSQQAAWKMLDDMYQTALRLPTNPIVIHVAPYSAIETAELVKMHVASPLIWRWVAKDIFWEEVQYGRVANTHGDTFATCA
jgi:hypothetical protein